MNLSNNQIQLYNQNGYLVIEDMLDVKHIEKCKEGINDFESLRGLPNIICDDDGKIRSVFAPDKHVPVFDEIAKSKLLVKPSSQIIRDNIYLYQYKLNIKKPFAKQIWEWHQDFPYWQIDDGVPAPDMLSVMIYLSNARAYQGPLTVIPGSHKYDIVEFAKKEMLSREDLPLIHSLGADLKYTISETMVHKLADENGIDTLEYKAGTVIFFHPNLFHCSNSNLSPYSRDMLILTYNSVNNLPKFAGKRPEYICSTNYEALNLVEEIREF